MRTLSIGDISHAPLKLFDSMRIGRGDPLSKGFVPHHYATWSDHYRQTERTPHIVDPAPWVMAHYHAKAPRRIVAKKQE